MASFTLDQDYRKPMTQDQIVIEMLSRYVESAEKLIAALSQPPALVSQNEVVKLMVDIGKAKGDAQLAGYLWPE
jgi:hypothetical protein